MSELQNNIWWLIFVASSCSLAKPSKPSVGLWIFFFPISLWTPGLEVVTVHTCVLTGQWEQRGSLLVPVVGYLSASSCFPQGHRNHGCPMISDCVCQQPLSFWTAEPQTGPPTDLWRMVRFLFASHLDNMSKWGLATWLLYYCPSSETCLT